MKQAGTKRIQGQAWLMGKCDPLGIVQESKIWSYSWIIYAPDRF